MIDLQKNTNGSSIERQMNDFQKFATGVGLLAAVLTLVHAAQTGKWQNGHTAMAAISVASIVLPQLKTN
jgi:hypothetical protein